MVGFAGFVDSIAGGGGLLTTPTYLFLGLPPQFILGTNKCVSTFGTTMAVSRFIKNKSFDYPLVVYSSVFAILGSGLGAYLSKFLNNERMVYLLLIVTPIILVLNQIKAKPENAAVKNIMLKSSLIGFFIGGYDGFFGPGTGTFLMFAFTLFLNMNLLKASANARIINFASNISAFFLFLYKGFIVWKLVPVAISGALIGNYFGSGYVIKGNVKLVKVVFNLVLLGLLVKSIYDLV